MDVERVEKSRDLRIIPTRQVADKLACRPRQVPVYCQMHGVPFTRLSPKNCGMTPDNLALLLQRTTRLETDTASNAGDVSELVK